MDVLNGIAQFQAAEAEEAATEENPEKDEVRSSCLYT